MRSLLLGLLSVLSPPDLPPREWLELEKKVTALTEKILPATVALYIDGAKGSGVIVTAQGHVATAGHLFKRPGRRVRAVLANGRTAWGQTLGRNAEDDYALVLLRGEESWPFAPMGSIENLQPGDPCIALGHPGGYVRGRAPVLRLGRVTSLRGQYVGTDCIINLGDSGGPLFDLEGRVIGIHSEFRPWISSNYHTAIDKLRADWERLVAAEAWSKGTRTQGRYVRQRNGRSAAFTSLCANLRPCVVRIREGGRTRALGTVVGAQGEILTKASTLPAAPRCQLPDLQGELPAEVIAVDKRTDLALLRVKASTLVPIVLAAPEQELRVGQWAVSVGPGERPLGVGVVSLKPRAIPLERGFLGVGIENALKGVRVTSVDAGSAAERARLRKADQILTLDGQPVSSVRALQAVVRERPPGSRIAVEVQRGDERLELEARLDQRGAVIPPNFPRRRMELSLRRSGFPLVIQHDTPLQRREIGAPVIDSRGRLIGINIARADRTQSYALTVSVVANALVRMRAGITVKAGG